MADQELPTKYQNIFKNAVHHYEENEYQKGLEQAESVLKRYPEHGESLAVKALLMKCLNPTDKQTKIDSYDLVKKGIKLNNTSPVSWRVFGLLFKSEGEFGQAATCFSTADRCSKAINQTILHDLFCCQLQVRDFKGLSATAKKMLQENPKRRQYWLLTAFAEYMCGNYAVSAQHIDGWLDFEKSMKDSSDMNFDFSKPIEISEMLIFKCMALEKTKAGDMACLALLQKSESQFLDKTWFFEKRGKLLLKFKKYERAQTDFSTILKMFPETLKFHILYFYSLFEMQIDDKKSESEQLLDMAATIKTTYSTAGSENAPKVAKFLEFYQDPVFKNLIVPNQMFLQILPVEMPQFKEKLESFVDHFLEKSIPSLFGMLKTLYNPKSSKSQDVMSEKAKELESLFSKKMEMFDATGVDPSKKKSPSYFVFVVLFLAQHYDHLKQYAKALEMLEKAVQHTPTLVELYLVRSAVYKHMGNLPKALENSIIAFDLDQADRYCNTKLVKICLKNDDMELAKRYAGRFSKADANDPMLSNNLHDMQCYWYEIESGKLFSRALEKTVKEIEALEASGAITEEADKEKYEKLKETAAEQFLVSFQNFYLIEKHFQTIQEDQYDFHGYAFRNPNLKTYLETLEWQDNLKSNKIYFEAESNIARLFLDYLIEKPNVAKFIREKAETIQRKKEKKQKKKEHKKKENAPASEPEFEQQHPVEELIRESKPVKDVEPRILNLQKFHSGKEATSILAQRFASVNKQ